MTPAAAPALAHHQALQLSRRLDWRFLLPEPDFGQVLYVGADDPQLMAALESSAAVQRLAGRGGGQGRYDLVVAKGADFAAVGAALLALQPGGWLYWEAGRIRHHVRFLEAVGLGDIALHWHFPSFAACTRILPLKDLSHRDQGFFASVFSARKPSTRALGWLARCGLVLALAASVSIVARKPPAGPGAAKGMGCP
ncbi:MAG: hypothetical protein M3Z21_01195 [Pseudomonadota bacterium]|nr:hypothetical protein [Pseudomonadota bacterium]